MKSSTKSGCRVSRELGAIHTLLIAFVPLAKSQDAVVLAEVKVPLTETTYFCYDKAVTGFNPPYDKTGFELLI